MWTLNCILYETIWKRCRSRTTINEPFSCRRIFGEFQCVLLSHVLVQVLQIQLKHTSLHSVDRFFSGNWRRYTSKFWRIFALMNLLWIYYYLQWFDIYVITSVPVLIEIVYLLIECSTLSIVWISCTLHLRVLRVVLQNFRNRISFIWELLLLGTFSFTFRECVREVFTSRF